MTCPWVVRPSSLANCGEDLQIWSKCLVTCWQTFEVLEYCCCYCVWIVLLHEGVLPRAREPQARRSRTEDRATATGSNAWSRDHPRRHMVQDARAQSVLDVERWPALYLVRRPVKETQCQGRVAIRNVEAARARSGIWLVPARSTAVHCAS